MFGDDNQVFIAWSTLELRLKRTRFLVRRATSRRHLIYVQKSIMASSSNPITSVSQTQQLPVGLQPHLVARLLLDLRGQRFSVDRETIMNLPESVLLCLFPNGLVLSRNSAVLDAIEGDEDEEVYGVDVRCIPITILVFSSLFSKLLNFG